MPSSEPSSQSLASSMHKLKVSQSSSRPPVDSWEDEGEEKPADEARAAGTITPTRPDSSYDHPKAPPPTPASPSLARHRLGNQQLPPPTPSYADDPRFIPTSTADLSPPRDLPDANTPPARRPEKSTAVAARLIAAGIGEKAPKRTPEQREHDLAMRAQEKKRREQAREADERREREAEKAKQAMWDD